MGPGGGPVPSLDLGPGADSWSQRWFPFGTPGTSRYSRYSRYRDKTSRYSLVLTLRAWGLLEATAHTRPVLGELGPPKRPLHPGEHWGRPQGRRGCPRGQWGRPPGRLGRRAGGSARGASLSRRRKKAAVQSIFILSGRAIRLWKAKYLSIFFLYLCKLCISNGLGHRALQSRLTVLFPHTVESSVFA